MSQETNYHLPDFSSPCCCSLDKSNNNEEAIFIHFHAQVSWIRHRDIHILTVGAYTYTSDQRFQATHHKETEDWILQIKWVQKRDAGKYECQVRISISDFVYWMALFVPAAALVVVMVKNGIPSNNYY